MNTIGTIRPKKRFGQNFLTSQHIISKIIHAIGPTDNNVMVEIGPGQGAITSDLIDRVNHLHLIEIDRDLASALALQFTQKSNLTIYQQDALKFDFSTLLSNDSQKLRIVGNLPYNISTPLLFHLLNYLPGIQDMYFMLQYEVVQRLCATSGTKEYGRLSVMINYHCQTQALFTVPPSAFYPCPKVNSAIIALRPHSSKPSIAVDEELFSNLVRDAFNQRRKTLANALKTWLPTNEYQFLDIDPKLRPDHLTVEQFVKISNHCHNIKK